MTVYYFLLIALTVCLQFNIVYGIKQCEPSVKEYDHHSAEMLHQECRCYIKAKGGSPAEDNVFIAPLFWAVCLSKYHWGHEGKSIIWLS